MINFIVNNRVAIVTGVAQGFGYAITERFINSGRPCFKGDSCRMGINCSCGFHLRF